jgi:hypothetical protein
MANPASNALRYPLQGSDLIHDLPFDLLDGLTSYLTAAESEKIEETGMRTRLDTVGLGHGERLMHDARIAGVKSASDVGRADYGEHL